jgi:dTMP kinase
LDWCKSPDDGLPEPDLVLFIDLPPEVAAARSGYGEERYEKLEFQIKVRKMFDQLRNPETWQVNWRFKD